MSLENQDKENKVLEFPVEKAKAKKSEVVESNEEATFSKSQFVSATSLFVVLLFAAVNTSVFSGHKRDVQSRGLASLGELEEVTRDIRWEHALASHLANKPMQRSIASIGQRTTKKDALLVSLLHNKYSVKFEQGKIVSIQLPPDALDRPEYIDGHKFLSKHKSLMSIQYASAKMINEKREENRKFETYDLLSQSQKTLGQVQFEMDKFGRMISMHVHKDKQ